MSAIWGWFLAAGRLHSRMVALLRAVCTWAEARSEVRRAEEVHGEGEADKTIPGSCFSSLDSGDFLCYPELVCCYLGEIKASASDGSHYSL